MDHTDTSHRETKRRTAAVARTGAPPGSDRIIREPECQKITGLSRTTRWRLERKGTFPRRRRISPGCSGWIQSEITAWITERANAGK